MKFRIETTLTGASWWKQILLYFLLTLGVVIPFELALMRLETPGTELPLVPVMLFLLVLMGLLIVIDSIFTLLLTRIFLSSISVNGKKAVLGGDTFEFVKLNLVCFGLTIITLGFYGPRYLKRQTDYLIQHCSIDGTACSFFGTTKKIFKYIYLALVLPLTVWLILFIVAAVGVALAEGSAGFLPVALLGVLYLCLFFIGIPFAYYSTKWYFNITHQGRTLTWNTQFWPSFFYLCGQLFLLIATCGIAWPVAILNCWKYFTEQTVIKDNNIIAFTGSFDGTKRSIFFLFWGQALLCIITLGIYSPWAYAKCLSYLLNSTSFKDATSDFD